MYPRKEYHKHALPHFQQPGQAYFITWCLKDSIPKKALSYYTKSIESIRAQIKLAEDCKKDKLTIGKLKQELQLTRKKYIHSFDLLMTQNQNNDINLLSPEIFDIVYGSLMFWEQKRLTNHAFCIMPNHIHWVFLAFEKDIDGKAVYWQDIMQSVKRHSANRINKIAGRTGNLWQKESFDTTIRDEKHLMTAISYTLNNPVVAGLVTDWHEWKGCFSGSRDF